MECKCIIGNINEISKISDKFIDKKIKNDNLPILRNHIRLFYILPHTKEKMLFNEVWKTWGISKSSLSDIVVKYVNLGIIEKIDCPEDKRTVYLRLTEKAFNIIEKLDSYEEEFTNIILEGFKDDKYIFKENIFKALLNAEKYLRD
ncbi:MAG: winged helix DNA-binding protein [Clostridium sp.]|uniref:winged helix DNA-binding protein n=1 Tax=Clostridium sp. TaxID=1506 RepID=UPI003F416163